MSERVRDVAELIHKEARSATLQWAALDVDWIAEQIYAAVRAAVLAERERCAKIAENAAGLFEEGDFDHMLTRAIATAIRSEPTHE